MHFHLVATQVWHHNHGQPAAILKRVHEENLILISTGASDWTDSYGSATKVDGGFLVSARKAPSSGAPGGDLAVTSFPWTDGPDGPHVIHCVVPFSAEGVSIDETWNSMGIRASGSHTIVFDEVFVPDEAVSLIRARGPWHPLWNAVIGSAMPLIMSAYLGAAERATEVALEMARAKADQQHIPPLVGQMLNSFATAHDAVGAMVSASENLTFDGTGEHSAFVLTRKTIAAEAMIETARRAVDVVGGAGYSRGNELERIFRDIHGCQFHPLPAAKQIQFTGRLALGLDPLGS
jgi:alkylation response protein AidB-like acyl-CoA dehydrogenase